MTAQELLAAGRHRYDPGAGDLLRLERLIHGNPQDDRESRGETALHLIEGLYDPLIGDRFPERRVLKSTERGLVAEVRNHVRPVSFRAGTDLVD